ncbi:MULTISPECIES: 7-carboxy-7-deazaguanine synthase QueE [Metabacillus]|uniref:7-carboxy-7-deazaguanine synthase QueE n=1 Tax=Metabacillus hrfriensis TaxID=3048891 RepID=A0ACD4RG50_9BACI|nr:MULTISPECIES: 7-carboxy-7-deazaguanine synthase QueE [Metabacillus]UAL53912.1 7-carboxy-7-deazaguanine synthase QueE [Metabacillus dongyingensis]USK30224.1 7-carboxy-7-deazaguanine synthase QueE [Bacillus sp. CMF21]WHZ59471.1 7-carboxy-7-deazaguanine synthase QueE [Metabacillus sp. CT-WN-B3]
MKKFPVLEIFGPTIQGEGMVIGQKTMFVRTAGCDYSCSWCDSAFTWDGSAKDDIRQLTAEEIWSELFELGGSHFSHVTISGGNPALLGNLNELIDLLHEKKVKVAIETQGSRLQPWFDQIDDLTISPKPPSSGMKTDFDKLDEIVRYLTEKKRLHHASLKVVVFDEQDLEYAKMVHKKYPEIIFYLQVGNDLVQEPDDGKLITHLLTRYEWLIDRAVSEEDLNNARVLPQLHTLVWGNKRGV